jgi:hypothetical protein
LSKCTILRDSLLYLVKQPGMKRSQSGLTPIIQNSNNSSLTLLIREGDEFTLYGCLGRKIPQRWKTNLMECFRDLSLRVHYSSQFLPSHNTDSFQEFPIKVENLLKVYLTCPKSLAIRPVLCCIVEFIPLHGVRKKR